LLDQAFLDWLRQATEARWLDPSLDGAVPATGELAWQPGTRWRGGISDSDLVIVEAMFGVTFPPDLRRFLQALHTPDPAMAGIVHRGHRITRIEERLFPDWIGEALPLVALLARPVDGLLQAVEIGRWHAAWGVRPRDPGERSVLVRRLAAGGPQLIPVAGSRYLAARPGCDGGPVLAIHGSVATVVAPDLRAALLRELGLADPDPDPDPDRALGRGAAGPDPTGPVGPAIPFWGDVVDGLRWLPFEP
jgi:hypothetical protein